MTLNQSGTTGSDPTGLPYLSKFMPSVGQSSLHTISYKWEPVYEMQNCLKNWRQQKLRQEKPDRPIEPAMKKDVHHMMTSCYMITLSQIIFENHQRNYRYNLSDDDSEKLLNLKTDTTGHQYRFSL